MKTVLLHGLGQTAQERKTAVAWFVGFHVAAVCAVVIISFVFLIFGDNLFLPLVRPV